MSMSMKTIEASPRPTSHSGPRSYYPPSQLAVSHLSPQPKRTQIRVSQPPGGTPTFVFSETPREPIEIRLSRRSPPGGHCHADLSTLEPYEVHPTDSPKTKRSLDGNLYHAHMAGVQAAHVTAGRAAPRSPPVERSAWAEPANHAGSPTHVSAKLQTKGSRHFFGQAVWPTPEGELAPYHGESLSLVGLRHQTGHYEAGMQHPDDPGELTPRTVRRGTKEVSSEQWRGGRPGTPHAGRASATGVMAKKASSIFFDGSQAKDLISGISCLS
jgi:hypothetical protein